MIASKNKKIIPYSALVLYAKHWIKFPWIKGNDEESFIKEMKTILYMCDYIAFNKNDVYFHVLRAIDSIKEEYIKLNVNIPYEMRDFYSFNNELAKYMNIYDIKDFQLATIKMCLSALSMLDIRMFAVRYIDYQKNKLTMTNTKQGETYKSIQKKFNKVFADLLTMKSYEEKWYYTNLKQLIK